jgi:hypothetical protein
MQEVQDVIRRAIGSDFQQWNIVYHDREPTGAFVRPVRLHDSPKAIIELS